MCINRTPIIANNQTAMLCNIGGPVVQNKGLMMNNMESY